jgi:hypothetical protein
VESVVSARDWQFEIDGLMLGGDSGFHLYDFTSETDLVVKDAARASADGVRFGRDTRAGSVFTIDMGLVGDGPDGVMSMLDALQAIWRGDAYRQTPSTVNEIHLVRPGRESATIFGRTRKITPASMENVASGYIPVVAEFQGADDLFYEDEVTQPILIRPASIGGFTVPVIAPWSGANVVESISNVLPVGGTAATWMCMDIYGPISTPVIEVVGQFILTINTSLTDDQWITIDPRPWARSAKTNTGANVAGLFSSSSPRLSDLKLAPGNHIAILRGTDVTGTARVDTRFRNAHAGY